MGWPKGRPSPFKGTTKVDALVRFFRFVTKDENGCWVWSAFKWKSGYACFWAEGKGHRAHRWIYEQLRGPVPLGKEPDHTCRNPGCVNPWHQEVVTHRVNVRRSNNAAGMNARKVCCIRGHAFTVENTYLTKKGQRYCRACMPIHEKAHRERQKVGG